MASRNQRSDIAPEQVLDQLRSMLSQYEPVSSIPAPFEPITGEPDPWSVPPPNGFDELRQALRRSA